METIEPSARVTFESAIQIAQMVRVSRLAFRQALDSLLGELGRSDLPRSFLHATLLGERRRQQENRPRIDPTTNQGSLGLALFSLGSRVAVANLSIAMVAQGLFDDEADGDRHDARSRIAARVLEVLGFKAQVAETTPGRPQRGEPQVFVDPYATWVDPNLLSPAILLAARRVCRISSRNANNEPVTGTGFLVGPSAVMTNWHVVKDLIALDAQRIDPGLLEFHFDILRSGLPLGAAKLSVQARSEGWLLAHSEMGDLEPPDAAVGWWQVQARRLSWQAEVAGELDFAVIAVDGAPGEQRGWYDLSRQPTFGAGGSCFVFHHPTGQPMAVTPGSVIYADGLRPVRVFHSASTADGSSGGLLVDDQGRAIALHHAGYGELRKNAAGQWPRIPEEVVNAAIPIAAIKRAISEASLAKIEERTTLSLPNGTLDGLRPLFGRRDLLLAIDAVAKGERRILWIKPPEAPFRRPGKTFSVEVMKALLPPPRNIYVELTADEVKAGGLQMAELIMERLLPGSSMGLSKPTDSGTTETAYFTGVVTHMQNMLASNFPDSLIWLVIDDLDVHTLADAGGRRFLDVLYNEVGKISELRIVLVGLRAALGGIPDPVLRPSPIEWTEFSDLGRVFQNWLNIRGARDRPLDTRVMRLLGDIVASCAGSESPLEALSTFTTSHLNAPLAKFFEEQR